MKVAPNMPVYRTSEIVKVDDVSVAVFVLIVHAATRIDHAITVENSQ